MLTGKLPLHIYKASHENAPLIISPVEISEKIWQTHSNYFSVLWIKKGRGKIETDFSKTFFGEGNIYCFNNYQAFSLQPAIKTSGTLLLFHPNFFCIETYQHEVGCNGVLFNQVYDCSPVLISPEDESEILQLLKNIRQEFSLDEIATNELVFSYLKILLIKLTRLKTAQYPLAASAKEIPQNLERLITLINENFYKNHSPSFYAEKLSMTLKNLNSICKKYFKKNISFLINEKLLLKSKWQLLHTDHQIKSIAEKLGFKDEFYFSRFFKKHIGIAPTHFRKTEWEIRKGFLSIP